MSRFLRTGTLFLGVAALFLAGCGGGSGSGVSVEGNLNTHGTVALVIADGPADEYSSIMVTVTEVRLIPEREQDGHVVIYRGRHTFDLLELRDEDLIFTVCRNVPAGRYSQIRLIVDSVIGHGGRCGRFKVPSGKIDLNPRGGFEVRAGGTVSIRLDIDANKSILIAGPTCIFRPVVFVDIVTGTPPWRCPRLLGGRVAEIIYAKGDVHGEIEGFTLALRGDRGMLDVTLTGDTIFFNEEGDAAGPEVLEVDRWVKVRGRLDAQGNLVASLVVAGDVVAVKGVALGSVDGEHRVFGFQPDADQGIIGRLDVGLGDGARVVIGCDQTAPLAVITEGIGCLVIGKLDVPSGLLKAALVFVRPREASGVIVDVTRREDLGGDDVTIETSPGTHVTVWLPDTARMVLEGDGVVPRDFLCAGRAVRALMDHGTISATEHPRVATLLLKADRMVGFIEAIEDDRVLVLGGDVRVRVRETATVLDLVAGEHHLIDVAALGAGDHVECFVLEICEGGEDVCFVLIRTPPPADD